MESTHTIGMSLRKLRKQRKESLEQTAKAVGVERSYLNKVELDKIHPSVKLLDKLIGHFSVEGNNATDLRQRAGHIPFPIISGQSGKEGNYMADQSIVAPSASAQVNVNPLATPVLFTDSTFVSSSNYGLVLDIAQTVGGQQHNVVARVGMSFDHAKKLIEIIQDHLEKNER